MSFRILDHGKEMSVGDLRDLFEAVMQATPQFRDKIDLTHERRHGQFDGYADKSTNGMWVGFAIGVRLAKRMKGGTQ